VFLINVEPIMAILGYIKFSSNYLPIFEVGRLVLITKVPKLLPEQFITLIV